ncbi:hypothetical protein BDW68DRAFT_189910 [Aspergillus falconensis]
MAPTHPIITILHVLKRPHFPVTNVATPVQPAAYETGWDRGHLFACRVIRRYARPNILPILAGYSHQSDILSSAEISKFVKGTESDYVTRSEHHLVWGIQYGISLGQIWAAMATIWGPQDSRTTDIPIDTDNVYKSNYDRKVKQLRYHTLQDNNFVDLGMIQIGSSSPLAEGSQGTLSVGYLDGDTHFLLNSPEDETLRLTSYVIRHILYFAPPQDLVVSPIVGFEKSRGPILEAKRHFQCLEDGQPVIVLLIHAAQHYMCFLHFKFSDEYL